MGYKMPAWQGHPGPWGVPDTLVLCCQRKGAGTHCDTPEAWGSKEGAVLSNGHPPKLWGPSFGLEFTPLPSLLINTDLVTFK